MLRSTFLIVAALVCPLGALAECVLDQRVKDKHFAAAQDYLERSASAAEKSLKRIKLQRTALDSSSHGMAEKITKAAELGKGGHALRSLSGVSGEDALSSYLAVLDYVLAVQDEHHEKELKVYAADILLDIQASILKHCTNWSIPVEFSERSLAQLKNMQEYVERDTLVISESER